MTFLAPLFLLGLAAIAVPVLIHLTQRERRTVVEFPSLMFLRKIPYESVKRRRIRDWLLLALRAAALALIVAAFARPFVRGSELSAAAGGAREVVLLLDRSYSMGAGDTWPRAQQAARQALQGLSALDRVSLVLFSSTAELVLRSSADVSRVVTEVEAALPSAGPTRYAPALKLASSLLAESQLPRKEAILVSDFQRAGWQPDEAFRLPLGSAFTPIAVEPAAAPNLSVTPLSLQRVNDQGPERVAVTAGVVNRGTIPASGVSLALEVDGRVVQSARVDVAPQSSAATTFAPIAVTGSSMRVVTRLGDDALAVDNAFHALVRPPEVLPVMIVGAGGRGDSDLYLLRALAIGDRPRFQATTHQVDALTPEALARTRVVVLQDLPIADALAARLKTFVEGGGGLVLALGPRASWSSGASWLPAVVTGTEDRTRGAAAKLSGFDYGHAVFEPFRAPRSGDFSTTRVYGYRVLTTTPGSVTLARFDGGTPALVEAVLGKGRVLAWATSLDLSWNDMALKPVYLPFVHQLVRQASGYREQPGWLTVGQAVDVSAGGSGAVVLTPSGQRRTPAEGSSAIELAEPGFYEVRDAREGQPLQVVASNVDLTESDPARVEPAEVTVAVTGQPGGGNDPGTTPTIIPDEVQEQAQRIWWYLLFAGILLLIAESWLARRLAPVRH
ncbi:MAG: BatA and WFA domain-containing protein [Vicinamibacterales bacterium]